MDGNRNLSARSDALSEDLEEIKARIIARSVKTKGEQNSHGSARKSSAKRNNQEGEEQNNDEITTDKSQNLTSPTDDKAFNDGQVQETKDDEFVVLDPNHPQMLPFQKSLKDLLEKQTTRVAMEVRELSEDLKKKRQEREEIGVQLYHVQQELVRQQTNLEKQNKIFEEKTFERQQSRSQLVEMRSMLEKKVKQMNKEKSKLTQLQTELDNLNLRVFYLENAKENIAGDIATIKRATIKSDKEMRKAEELKQQQDLFVERLTQKAIHLAEELSDQQKQLLSQIEETKLAKEAMNESQMELESLNVEKKRLINEWTSSFIALKKREENYVKMSQELDQLNEKSQTIVVEKDAVKKLIEKEQEKSERLTSVISKIEYDINRVEKQIAQCKRDIEENQDRCLQISKILRETEAAYNRAATEKNEQTAILDQLRKDLEKQYLERVEIEDRMMDKMQKQLTLNNATKYTNKMIKKIRDRTKELDTQISNIENDLSKRSMDETCIQVEINFLEKMLQELNLDVQQKYDAIAKGETEISRRNVLIERKQNQIDLLSKKLSSLTSEMGGLDMAPMAMQIKSLRKSIGSTHENILEAQQLWLKDQAELVKLVKAKNEEEATMENYKNEMTIYTQKLMRVEGQICRQNNELQEIDKSINDMRNDTIKLNTLITKEKGSGQALAQNQKLSLKDYEASLREAEKEALQMQERLESTKEERERLCEALVEAEKQMMLWTKKIQLAQEARDSVDGEAMQNEVKSMRTEIHRMEVRLNQLNRDYEKKCQEMEKLMASREAHLVRGEALKTRNQTLIQNTMKRELTDVKRKISSKNKEVENLNGQLHLMAEEQKSLSERVTAEHEELQRVKNSSRSMDSEIEQIFEDKQKAFIDTLMGQLRMKCYQQMKENKYKKSTKYLETEYKKQVEQMSNTLSILNNLMNEFPEARQLLKKAALTYGSKASTAGF